MNANTPQTDTERFLNGQGKSCPAWLLRYPRIRTALGRLTSEID